MKNIISLSKRLLHIFMMASAFAQLVTNIIEILYGIYYAVPSKVWSSTASMSCPTLIPPASNAAPLAAMLMTRGIGCLVSAPPSIAMPRLGRDLATTTRNLPSLSLCDRDVCKRQCSVAQALT